jgi:hypothetical protein
MATEYRNERTLKDLLFRYVRENTFAPETFLWKVFRGLGGRVLPRTIRATLSTLVVSIRLSILFSTGRA